MIPTAGARSSAIALGGGTRRGSFASLAVLVAAVAVLVADVAVGTPGFRSVAVIASAILVTTLFRTYVAWSTVIAVIVVTILFVPIGRYTLPVTLPLQLELYRLVVAIALLAWAASLLVDSRTTFRTSGLHIPVYAFSIVMILSLAANPFRLLEYDTIVLKRLMFFGSFILVYLMIMSALRSTRSVWLITQILVGGGAVVAFSAIIESRSGFNAFDHLSQVFPFLQQGINPNETSDVTGYARGGSVRAYASAQHPIALGAALMLLVPLSVALARKTRKLYWWLAAAALLVGSMATLSRVSVIMIVVIGLVFLRHRPTETKRLWPLLIPLVIAIHFALPGTLGTLKDSFFPEGGLVAQQQRGGTGSGRVASLGPTLRNEFLPNPIVGEGFGTRITTSEEGVQPNAPILDDEWLGILAETGVAGILALLWLFGRFVRRAGAVAKRSESPEAWLLTAIVASVAAFGVGMLTFDAFSFIQVTLVFFILLALGGVLYEELSASRRVEPIAA